MLVTIKKSVNFLPDTPVPANNTSHTGQHFFKLNRCKGNIPDIYGTVYGVRNDADASGGTIKMNEGAVFNLYGGLSFNKNEAKADNNVVTINNGKVVFAVYGGQAQGHDADASGNIVSISGSNSELSFEGGAHSVAGGFCPNVQRQYICNGK